MELTWQFVVPQEVTKWITDAVDSSSSTVSQSSGSANSWRETPKGGATTRSQMATQQHLTDPLAIAIAARDQWMFNDLLIGFWLFKSKKKKGEQEKPWAYSFVPALRIRWSRGKTFQATLININALHKRANTLGTTTTTTRPRTERLTTVWQPTSNDGQLLCKLHTETHTLLSFCEWSL